MIQLASTALRKKKMDRQINRGRQSIVFASHIECCPDGLPVFLSARFDPADEKRELTN